MNNDEISMTEFLATYTSSLKLTIHTALPAKVVASTNGGNTVTVELMVNQVLSDGSAHVLPPLADVVVQYPSAGGFAVTFPLKKGDEGLVTFAERCIDGWWESGGKSIPLDSRTHCLSDGFFNAGCSSKPNAISDIRQDAIVMRKRDNSAYFAIDEGGVITADGTKMVIKCPIEMEDTTLAMGQLTYQNGLAGTQGGGVQEMTGGFTVNGDIVVKSGDVVADGISLKTHIHGGVLTGGAKTEKPE